MTLGKARMAGTFGIILNLKKYYKINYLLYYVSPAVQEKIDFSFFRKIDATFVSGHFGISFSDVVYETRLATGAPDGSVPFRCARMEKIGEALLLLTLRYPGTTNLFISQ